MKKTLLTLMALGGIIYATTTETLTTLPTNTFRLTVFEESGGLIANFTTGVIPADIITLAPAKMASGADTNKYANKLLVVKAKAVLYGANITTVQLNVERLNK